MRCLEVDEKQASFPFNLGTTPSITMNHIYWFNRISKFYKICLPILNAKVHKNEGKGIEFVIDSLILNAKVS